MLLKRGLSLSSVPNFIRNVHIYKIPSLTLEFSWFTGTLSWRRPHTKFFSSEEDRVHFRKKNLIIFKYSFVSLVLCSTLGSNSKFSTDQLSEADLPQPTPVPPPGFLQFGKKPCEALRGLIFPEDCWIGNESRLSGNFVLPFSSHRSLATHGGPAMDLASHRARV